MFGLIFYSAPELPKYLLTAARKNWKQDEEMEKNHYSIHALLLQE